MTTEAVSEIFISVEEVQSLTNRKVRPAQIKALSAMSTTDAKRK